jgi:outer membrane protein OmpA-like peptidoglycan-associated protein
VRQKRQNLVGDYEVEKFSLILFDFDKATIEGMNKNIVEFIKKRIKSNSEVQIVGYSDRTGDQEYNKRLSEERAKSTKKELKRIDANAFGLGEEVLLYDNDLPEGRFYCRTVEIIVKTKIFK